MRKIKRIILLWANLISLMSNFYFIYRLNSLQKELIQKGYDESLFHIEVVELMFVIFIVFWTAILITQIIDYIFYETSFEEKLDNIRDKIFEE